MNFGYASQQPLFTQVFPNIKYNPVAMKTRPFTDVETDPAGNETGTIAAQGNDLQAGTGTLYNFAGVFTGALNVPAAGQVTFTFSSDDAFVLGTAAVLRD